ncbi:MAG TPA: PHB depolymerase family esterase, partial [Plasticicumulans sp.]|nr:PHB depolymerase family esterase [Plasticicumulans sp.]
MNALLPRLRTLAAALATLALLAHAATGTAEPLRRYNVDPASVSVSGISSGGYMAVQFAVAYSGIVHGVGVVAGGPYGCANASITTALDVCMAGKRPIRVADLVSLTKRRARSGAIDPVAGLAAQRVWIFTGSIDSTVVPKVGDALEQYYRAFVPAASITRVSSVRAEHTMPTTDFGNDCTIKGDPYISDCDFDGAGELLQWIHGPLQPPAATAPGGRLTPFEQDEFSSFPAAHSLFQE